MSRVIIESPYRGDVEKNVAYAHEAMRYSLECGESPFANHLMYPQVNDPEERKRGFEAGWNWFRMADKVAVYVDRGITEGMQAGIDRAKKWDIPIVYRSVEGVDTELLNK